MKSSEDIISGLEVCSKPGRSCCSDECPYYKQNTSCTSMELKQDALALIKQYYVVPTIQLTIPYGELYNPGCGDCDDCICRICARAMNTWMNWHQMFQKQNYAVAVVYAMGQLNYLIIVHVMLFYQKKENDNGIIYIFKYNLPTLS